MSGLIEAMRSTILVIWQCQVATVEETDCAIFHGYCTRHRWHRGEHVDQYQVAS
jgi:hypothetical protein